MTPEIKPNFGNFSAGPNWQGKNIIYLAKVVELERTLIMLTLVEFDISHCRREFGTISLSHIAVLHQFDGYPLSINAIRPIKLFLGPF
jgi:hypothetical protein